MKAAVIVFPGSNCDRDVQVALESVTRRPRRHGLARRHQLPAGRPDRAARRLLLRRLSALRRHGRALAHHARRGRARPKAGTPVSASATASRSCCEAGLLPGALMRNARLQVRLPRRDLAVENARPLFTAQLPQGRGRPHPDRARRRQLLRRRRHARPARGRGPRRVPLRRRAGASRPSQPQRLAAQHRRHLQRTAASSA